MLTLALRKQQVADIDLASVEGISDLLTLTSPESGVQLTDCAIDVSQELGQISTFNKEILLLNAVISSRATVRAQKDVAKQRLGYVNDMIEYMTSALTRLASALEQEYSPFFPNEEWFSGLMDGAYASCVRQVKKERHDIGAIIHTTSQPYSIFSKPIPQQVWQAYKKAKESKLFDAIVVYSPESWDFSWVENELSRSVEHIVLKGDPVLVGYIGLWGTPEIAWKFDEREGEKAHALIECPEQRQSSFLISQWGL